MLLTPNEIGLDFDTETAGFEILLGDSRAQVTFLNAPVSLSSRSAQNALSFWVKEDIRATVYLKSGHLHVLLSQDKAFPETLRLRIAGLQDLQMRAGGFTARLGGRPLSLDVMDASIAREGDDGFVITLLDTEMRLEFSPVSLLPPLLETQVEAFSTPPLVVPAGVRTPDFSVGVFDDLGFLRPRPLRLGVPVISTVPCLGGAALTPLEQNYLDLGAGPNTRTMFFRVICNTVIESGLAVGSISALATLQIALPGGIDTVQPNLNIPLTYQGVQSEQAVYTAQFDFFKEDTICSVDGFLYAAVFCAMTVRRGLPMRLQITTNGSPYTPPSYQDASVEAIRTFSTGHVYERISAPALPLQFKVV